MLADEPGLRGLSLGGALRGAAVGDRGGAAATGGEEGAPDPVWGRISGWQTRLAGCCCGSGSAKGLLGGMTELPGTEWRSRIWTAEEALALAPQPAEWRAAGQVRHGFTHFELIIDLFAARVEAISAPGFVRPVDALAQEALPSVMRKCVRMAMG